MKLVAVITTLMLSISVLSYGQKIKWTAELDRPKDYSPKIIDEVGDYFYTCHSSEKEITLEKFEKLSMKNVFSKTYEIQKKNIRVAEFLLDNKLVVFFSVYDDAKKTSELYCKSYSTNDGTEIDGKRIILSVFVEKHEKRKFNRYKGFTEIRTNDNYCIYASTDNKKILVELDVYAEKEETYTTYFTLLDEKINKLVEKKETRKKSEYYTTGLTLDNEGSWYFQKNNIIDSDAKKTIIVSFDANKAFEKTEYVVTNKNLNLSDQDWISFPNITFNSKGNMVLIGEFLKNSVFTGYYFIEMNTKSKQIDFFKLNEFTKEFTNQFLTVNQIEKGKSGSIPEDFGGIQLTTLNDGSIVGIARRFTRGPLNRTSKQNGFVYHEEIGEFFIFKDIIAIHLSSDGKLLWANRIPCNQFHKYKYNRFQAEKKLDYFGYLVSLSNDKLCIMYHDKPSNVLIKSDNEKLGRFKMSDKAVISLFTVDLKTGKKTKEQFPESTGMTIHPEPWSRFQKNQSSNTLFLGSGDKKFQFGQFLWDK